jgi:anti-sigma regulatory factor (Ser/Thr protein kinase)
MSRVCALKSKRASVCLPARVDQVARAREFVLTTLGAGHPCTGVLQLIVDELVTNSIVHSESGREADGTVTVTLTSKPGRVRVEVTDAGSATLPRLREVGLSAENGRGLYLVAALAAAWNCSRGPSGTTATWAEVTS